MIQRAFQIRDGERGVRTNRAASDAIQSPSEFYACNLKLGKKLLQILVVRFTKAQFVGLTPEPDRAFRAAFLQRMPEIAALGANPVNPFTVRLGFRLRLVGCG